MGFPGGLDGKESACNVGDLGLIPGLGRSPGEGKIDLNLKSGEQTKAGQQNSVSLCPATFCTPNQTSLLFQVSLDFLLLHSHLL